MSDESVHAALRSDAPLVVVEALAGCGKTHQGADYARHVAADRSNRLLILTHTHATCAVFAERTRGSGNRVEFRTIDSLIAHVATAYHLGLDLPADVPTWAGRTPDGYRHVALRVAALLKQYSMIGATLAKRYAVVICDEHQDCSTDQHALGMAILGQVAKLRVFADPVQRVLKETPLAGSSPALDWPALARQADSMDFVNVIIGPKLLETLICFMRGCRQPRTLVWATQGARTELCKTSLAYFRGSRQWSAAVAPR